MIKRQEDYPAINERIMQIIERNFFGNVTQFSHYIGLKDSTKINRLFKRDKRNGEYPIPTTDIIMTICNAFNLSADWLLFNETRANTGDDINFGGRISNERSEADQALNELNDVVKQQQSQIDMLLKLLKNKE